MWCLSIPLLYTLLGEPFTVTPTLVMSGLTHFSLRQLRRAQWRAKGFPWAIGAEDSPWCLSLLSVFFTKVTTSSRITLSKVDSFPLEYALVASSANVLLRMVSYCSFDASKPFTTCEGEASVSSKTSSVACGWKTLQSAKIWWSSWMVYFSPKTVFRAFSASTPVVFLSSARSSELYQFFALDPHQQHVIAVNNW